MVCVGFLMCLGFAVNNPWYIHKEEWRYDRIRQTVIEYGAVR